MIERLYPLQFFKKSPYYGSCAHMQYRIQKKEEEMEVCIYPEPYNFDHTPEEKKEYFTFPFSEEGLREIETFLDGKSGEKDWKEEILPW